MTKEQEAIENLTNLLKQRNEKEVKITTFDLFENIETVLNMLKEKDKMIDLLAEKLGEITIKICPYDELKIDCSANSKKYWIEYFKQKATEMLQKGE